MQAITEFRQGLMEEGQERPFKRDKSGWAVAMLSTLSAVNAAFFFLGMLKVDFLGWMMMNTCTPSIALFVLGFLLESPVVMAAGATMMFRYGTLGLFVFGWGPYDLPGQIGHILMTLGVIYTLVHIVRGKMWRKLAVGVALGVAILIPLGMAQNWWFGMHPEMLEMLFSGNYALPE